MGDRAQVKLILAKDNVVYIYTHWGGQELPKTLQATLTSAKETEDISSLVFSHMILAMLGGRSAEEVLHHNTGFGISSKPIDGREIVVDSVKRTVTLPEYWGSKGGAYSFEEYIKLETFPPFWGT